MAERSSNQDDAMHSDLSMFVKLKEEVDALQVHVMGLDKPWYKQISNLVAVLALLFSFLTTYLSFTREEQIAQQASRIQLRELIQRIIEVPRQSFELVQKYNDQPFVAASFGSMFNQETAVLINQAYEITRGIRIKISSGEFLAVAQALALHGRLTETRELIDKAVSDDSAAVFDKIVAYRLLASIRVLFW
jgi:hypothetical protein